MKLKVHSPLSKNTKRDSINSKKSEMEKKSVLSSSSYKPSAFGKEGIYGNFRSSYFQAQQKSIKNIKSVQNSGEMGQYHGKNLLSIPSRNNTDDRSEKSLGNSVKHKYSDDNKIINQSARSSHRDIKMLRKHKDIYKAIEKYKRNSKFNSNAEKTIHSYSQEEIQGDLIKKTGIYPDPYDFIPETSLRTIEYNKPKNSIESQNSSVGSQKSQRLIAKNKEIQKSGLRNPSHKKANQLSPRL